jgi:hypothetical protein
MSNRISPEADAMKLVPYWCLLEAPRVPMPDDLCRLLVTFSLAPMDRLEQARAGILAEASTASMMMRIFDNRLAEDVKIDAQAWLWIGSMCAKPGDSVMFAYTISLLSWLNSGQEITMNTLVRSDKIFAWGVPALWEDDGDVLDIWAKQKRDRADYKVSDNWLDDPAFWDMNCVHFYGKGLDYIPAPKLLSPHAG